MKIRNGFVSNSSSSSFVVIFPREPKSASDVKEMLFKDRSDYANPYQYGDDECSWSTNTVANTVWTDICSQKKNDFVSAIEVLNSGSFDENDAPSYNDYKNHEDYYKADEIYTKKRIN